MPREPKGRGVAWTEERSDEGPPPLAAKTARRRLKAPRRRAGKAQPRVVVLDYGSGNLRSAERALARAGASVTVTPDLALAERADGLVVPGVGAYAACVVVF